jgi:hypothetical protein
MRRFDLGAVLMVAAHSLDISCPTARLNDLAELVNFMTGRPQVPYDPVVLRECGTAIVLQHRWITQLDIPEFGEDEDQKEAWLVELGKIHGVFLDIESLATPLERTPTDAMLALGAHLHEMTTFDPRRSESADEVLEIIHREDSRPPS